VDHFGERPDVSAIQQVLLGEYGAAGGGGGSLLLDTYGSAAVAYSTRKLSTAYAGSCMKVRRSSDNTTQNIGFVSNTLDTASLLTFCGAGNGFVDTWYDQSGNGFDVAQATQANQPQIVASGAVVTKNSLPSVQFDGVNDGLASAFSITSVFTNRAASIFVVEKSDNTTQASGPYIGLSRQNLQDFSTGFVFGRRTTNVGFEVGTGAGGTGSSNTGGYISADSNTTALSQCNAIIAASGGVISVYVDAANKTLTTFNGTMFNTAFQNTGTGNFRAMVGARNNNTTSTLDFPFAGAISEAVVWPADQSTNRTSIQTNQKTYFGTP
jgi:hypothetical protein